MFSDDKLVGFPLRQSLLPGAEGLRIFATRGVVDWLSRPDRYLVVCEGRGGRIYAADECFLEEAQQVIRDAHGAHVVLRKPEVHSYLDPALDAWVEPVVFLRIKTPHAYAREILAELHCRRARILEEDVQRYDLVIRAEGQLVHLLGLTRVIASVTRNSAAIWTWLDRYERAMTTPSIRSRTLDPNGPLEDPPSTDASPAARC